MFCLGLDIGYSNMKLALGDLGGSQPHLLLHPAGAAPVDRLPERIGGGADAMQVLVEGKPYAAGVSPDRLQDWNRVLHADYPATTSYRALFHAALLLTERDTVEQVVTGLPGSSSTACRAGPGSGLRPSTVTVCRTAVPMTGSSFSRPASTLNDDCA